VGGNTTDTYNWKIGSSNTGNDYFFENIPDCFDAPTYTSDDGPKYGYRAFVRKDQSVGIATLMTVPMMLGRQGRQAQPPVHMRVSGVGRSKSGRLRLLRPQLRQWKAGGQLAAG
jgi:hypothetical protein